MQPYFFPYLGYWQLMNAVDTYIVYDDVNYIKGGWINRNRIINNEVCYYNIQLIGASPNKHINQILINNDKKIVAKNEKTIIAAYGKAPCFDEVYPVIKTVLTSGITNLAEYLLYSFNIVSQYLDMNTNFILSSSMQKNDSLKGQDKIIDMCKIMFADEYYNAIGGKQLYSFDAFSSQGIELKFLESNPIIYKQNKDAFIPNLSIIDVLMFNDKKLVKDYLLQYRLVGEDAGLEK